MKSPTTPAVVALAALALAAGLLVCACGSDSPAQDRASGRAGSGAPGGSELGAGFLVWESNRSGTWRIWRRDLADPGPRQLTPDEPGRWHCCPHIAPDGGRVAYLSLPAARKQEYPDGGAIGELRLIGSEGEGERVLAEAASTYFENRAVVWRDAGSLIFIDGQGRTRSLDVETGYSSALTGRPEGSHPWLLNRQLTWAAGGRASFAVYDRRSKELALRVPRAGCQPYFSHDGRWGFWMGGAGGPVDRMDLATGEITTLLRKGDERLDPELAYVYFPMASRDGLLFAWAASAGAHNHFESDYEVFVAESDPDTLELISEPVRMTHHPGTDRFPDVFLEPLPLGRLRGEAPLEVRLAPPGGPWQWSFGDGSTAVGDAVEHSYARPGSYELVAVSGDRELRGAVRVAAAAPPRPLWARLAAAGSEIRVAFDEEIDAAGLTASLASGTGIEGSSLSADGRGVVLRLARPLDTGDVLSLDGVVDRSGGRLSMAPAELPIEPPLWPSVADGLLFLWQTGETGNLVRDPVSGLDRATTLSTTGRARLDRHFTMRLAGGAFESPVEQSERVLAGLRRTNEVSLEAVLHVPADARASGRIVAFAGGRQGQNFRLGQSGDRLQFTLRVGPRGRTGNPVVELMKVSPGESVHVVVAYRPGRLVAYRNGESTLDTDSVRGDFYHWQSRDLRFGAEADGSSDWAGSLEGVAVYDRVLAADEVAENHRRYRALLDARPEAERTVVLARRARTSRVPTLAEISPYRRALVVSEFTVEDVYEGASPGRTVRVAEWALLDGERLPLPTGGGQRLVLEAFAENRQLEAVYLSDTLDGAAGKLHYAAE